MEWILENRKNLSLNVSNPILRIIFISFFLLIISSCKKNEKTDVWISPIDELISFRSGELVCFKDNKICFGNTRYHPDLYCFNFFFDADSEFIYINDTNKYVNILPDTLIEIIEKSENKMIWKINQYIDSNVQSDTIRFVKLRPNTHSINEKNILKRLLNSSWIVKKDRQFYSTIRFTSEIVPPFPPKSFLCFSIHFYQKQPQTDNYPCAKIENWNIQKIEDNVFLNIQNIGLFNQAFHITSFKKDTIKAYYYGNDTIFNMEFISLPTYEDYPENM